MGALKAFCVAACVMVGVGPVSAATFLVEQYDTYLGTNLSDYELYAAANTPDYTALVDEIDYTDDPAGFAGNIPGSSPWPGEVETGLSGKASAPNTTFFARITATFNTFTSDTFHFRTFNDDGVFLLINGDLVINDPSLHAEKEFTGSKILAPGKHELELIFFENGGEASLEFSLRDSAGTYTLDGSDSNLTFDEIPVSPVPLPASGVALMAGLAAVGALRRRRRAA